MKRRSQSKLELAVGALVSLSAAVFLVFAFTGGGLFNGAGYSVVAKFRQIDGISVGSAIHLAGIKIGEVSKLGFDAERNQAVVTMRLRSDVQLPEDTAAQIVTDGLLGPKFVKLEPGGADEIIPPGGRLQYVQDGLIIERILQKLIENAETNRRERLERTKPCDCNVRPGGAN
jgi:phospholipid/cholesterol/gamma-HCH transport system substrate-binding protein